jgi:hypothetical protein
VFITSGHYGMAGLSIRLSNTHTPRDTLPMKRARAFFSQRYAPPFRHALPGTIAEGLQRETLRQKWAANVKLLRRRCWLQWRRQASLLCDRVPPPPCRILWLNLAAPSIGDSLMHLAGRALLGQYQLDLLTHEHNAELYWTDRYFQRVFADPAAVPANQHDFVLLDALGARSISWKCRLCPKLPFASVQGSFIGSSSLDYHRTLFSCYRIHHLLGYPHSEAELRPLLRPWLFVHEEPSPLPGSPRSSASEPVASPGPGVPRPAMPDAKRPEGCPPNVSEHPLVALALGGSDAARTYRRWPETLRLLRQHWSAGQPSPRFVLLGSSNALTQVSEVRAAIGGDSTVSLVNVSSLRASARAIADCDFFLGCDGGLMHCAAALGVPGIGLFGKIKPQLRLPPESTVRSLYHALDVNQIEPEAVANEVLKWACFHRAVA